VNLQKADEEEAKQRSITTETEVVANPKKPHALDPYLDMPDPAKDPVAMIKFFHNKTWYESMRPLSY